MSNVDYRDFERCLKRFGYTGRLTDNLLTEIQDDIHLRAGELRDNTSATHYYYQADHAFEKGNYDTQKLLVLGLLMCGKCNEKDSQDNLWGVVNPQIEEEVPREQVRKVLETICAYCIDVPLKHQMFKEERNEETIKYLKELAEKKQAVIDSIERELKPKVTMKDLFDVLVSYRSLF